MYNIQRCFFISQIPIPKRRRIWHPVETAGIHRRNSEKGISNAFVIHTPSGRRGHHRGHASLHARDTAAGLPGVTRVVNQIETEEEAAAEKSDTWIDRKVNFALLLRRNVSMTGTTVTVSDGVVTLAGEASSQAQKDLTASYAADVDGVVSVVNQPWSQPGQQPVDPGSDPDALRRGI